MKKNNILRGTFDIWFGQFANTKIKSPTHRTAVVFGVPGNKPHTQGYWGSRFDEAYKSIVPC